MRDTDNIAIPAAVGVDYTDVDEIYGYHLLLVKIFEREGGLNYPPVNNATIREIQRQGQIWLREVKFLISDIFKGETDNGGRSLPALAAIPDLIHACDFMYRICNGSPCFDFIRDVKLRTVDRWLKGDKSLTETQVVCLLWPMVYADPRNVDQRYMTYCSSCLGSWIKDLRQSGRFDGIADTEAYQRLNYLLNHDLYAFIAGGKEVERTTKLNWARAYLVDDISSLDTAVLRAYIPFARTVSDLKRTPFDESEAEYEVMAEELSSRPDLHPLYREAIRLGIETSKRLLAVCYPEETA